MIEPPVRHFGHVLRRFRLAAGLSQQALAEQAGLSVRGISDLERGQRLVPRPETVRSLVEALDLDEADRAELVAAREPVIEPPQAPEDDIPPILYARSGDISIAYQVIGDGPFNLVMTPGFVSNLELNWEQPRMVRFLRRLGSFSRLVLYDKRGTGLSDRMIGVATFEERMDDLRAVMDRCGIERAALMGVSEGVALSALFAATYPERVSALVLYGAEARHAWAPDYPLGQTVEEHEETLAFLRQFWGGDIPLTTIAPSLSDDEEFVSWFNRYLRLSASPGSADALTRMNYEIDVRDALPVIHVPTLVLNRAGDRSVPIAKARDVASRIPGAQFVELPGEDHLPYVGDQDALLNEVECFLTQSQEEIGTDGVLATVLAIKADKQAPYAHERLARVARPQLRRFRGREVQASRVSLLATFDGPARAIHCAASIQQTLEPLGVTIQTGLHTGEVEFSEDEVKGVAVDIAKQVAELSNPGDILTSRTVQDLVAGSGLRFNDWGIHRLDGVPERWRILAIDPASLEE